MGLVLVGMNHRTAPVALRERAAFGAPELPSALEELSRRTGGAEVVLLSTCNRVEAIAFSDSDATLAADLERFLAQSRRIPPSTLAPRLYRLRGHEAVAHVFRVASSLDSMVPGESQILAQVKEAYLASADGAFTGKHLNVLFQWAFRAGKRVHAHTGLARRRASVSSVAAGLARESLGDLSKRTVLVLGAGETGRLTLESLAEAGVGKLIVTSRTAARAKRVAREFGGRAVAWKDRRRSLASADLVVASTSSKSYVLSPADVSRRASRPLVVIDIAVPRNVHPGVGDIAGVRLYNIDDLERLVALDVDRRAREFERGLALVDHEVAEFEDWLEGHEAEESIGRIIRRATESSRAALEHLWARFPQIDAKRRREIAAAVERGVRRSLHEPIEALKRGAKSTGRAKR